MRFSLYLILLVVLGTAFTERGDPCTTPDGKAAKCVPLDTCQALFDAISSKNNTGIQLARNSRCGYDTEQLVCCEAPGPVILADFETKALPDKKTCGAVKEVAMIIGGRVTALGEFPWIAALEYNSKRTGEYQGIICGGSLINNKYILTAASCVINKEFELIGVWLGDWNIATDPDCVELVANRECADPVQKLKIKDKIIHPFFSPKNGYNDIGLIRLEKEVQFTDYIKPICLPSSNLPAPEAGIRMTVAGWGSTENETKSDLKLKVEVPVVSNEVCKQKLNTSQISPQQLCAGGEKGRDSCRGDLGQPLMRIYEDTSNDQMQWYQDGIVSKGVGCGLAGIPAIYTRVSSYMNWITKVISAE